MGYSPNGTRRRASAAVGVFLACATVGRGETALLARQSAWRYADTGTNLSTAWRARSYDDSAWSVGNGQLGYGDGDEATEVSYDVFHLRERAGQRRRRVQLPVAGAVALAPGGRDERSGGRSPHIEPHG